MIRRTLSALLLTFGLASLQASPVTECQYLSGHGPSDAVLWDFTVTGGRRAGEKTKIPVPSHWEQHGFGTYNYGESRHKGDEHGLYRTVFRLPKEWSERRIRLVFGAAMTDTKVLVNGQSSGPVHQGGFTQFSYDITRLVNFEGDNTLEVDVSKVSANADTERAERGGDYWVFGGLYRPVWIEASPAQAIDHVAIDAHADGTWTADVTLGALRDKTRPYGPSLEPERLEAQLLDANGQPVGSAVTVELPGGGVGRIRVAGRAQMPRLWTAETPALYTLRLTRFRAAAAIHSLDTRFGFRTFEVRKEGLFLNGQRILLKGANRHSFRPQTGRALDREQCYEDVRLLRTLNMNAVRMSHYPPDPAFLEACDELGLYVLNELSGWQHAHDTAVGRLLVRELVERDVNHPSILFWDNGNEGGWNRDLDGDFSLYDPQRRTVLHPWDPFGGIDTRHYTPYREHAKRLQGPNLVMPTEILHGLYDGGAGAGLDDYWQALVASPFGAGAFIWNLADEGIARSDQQGRIDAFSTFAPDGIVGPNFEKEGSYYTVRDLWSPVQIEPPVLDEKFSGQLTVQNRFEFTSLAECQFAWRLLRFASTETALASGTCAGPAVAPNARGTLPLALPANWRDADALELTALDPRQQPLWTWRWPTVGFDQRMADSAQATPAGAEVPRVVEKDAQLELVAGETVAAFDAKSGLLLQFSEGEKTTALAQGPRLVFAKPFDAAQEQWLPWKENDPLALTRHLAEPQFASVVDVELDLPQGTPYGSFALELSADGETWKTINDGSRRPNDKGRYEFAPQRVSAVRISKLLSSEGNAVNAKVFRIGYSAGRFQPVTPGSMHLTHGTDSTGAWIDVTADTGLQHFRWTLRGDGSLLLSYRYSLTGPYTYHGITFDLPQAGLSEFRWLGAGPSRVWQNRLRGTWLGLHRTAYPGPIQPGEAWVYPEFEGYYAGVRWGALETKSGTLIVQPGSPAHYLRLGTPRIGFPTTAGEYPPGDLSFMQTIPGMGSKFIRTEDSGPAGQPAVANGPSEGAVVFRLKR